MRASTLRSVPCLRHPDAADEGAQLVYENAILDEVAVNTRKLNIRQYSKGYFDIADPGRKARVEETLISTIRRSRPPSTD